MSAPLPPDETARLLALRGLAILDSAPEPEFDAIVTLASTVCETPIALVNLVDEARQWFKARVGLETTETPREMAFCAHAILERDMFVVHDAEKDPRFQGNALVVSGPRIRFYAGVPILAPDGQPVGTVCVADRVPRTLTAAQEEALTLLAHQVTHLLALRSKTAQLEESNRRSAEREARLEAMAIDLADNEATLRAQFAEAVKVQRIKNEFVSTVSHELRTPLTSIRGALGLLEGGVVGSLDREALEIIKIARSNSDRLIRLISDMLDLDKIEAGKLEQTITEASAASLAASAIDSVRGMAHESGILLESDVDLDLQARVDADRVVQVLTNLLSNAVKFSPSGASVTLRAKRAGDRARFEVEDRGSGIPPELRPRLFQKFQQLDSSDSRAKGGTGLGLAISKAIVEQLGGTIGVESAAGVGTTFWFEVERAHSHGSTPSPASPLPTVLVIEDDAALRSILVESIGEAGARVIEASDGAHGLHLVRAERPDAILLDLGIPRPNGFEVIAILQAEASRATPLVIYSGRDLSPAERAKLTLGETRFLTKTVATEEDIVRVVHELLSRTRG